VKNSLGFLEMGREQGMVTQEIRFHEIFGKGFEGQGARTSRLTK
jgi:hypothetical protein